MKVRPVVQALVPREKRAITRSADDEPPSVLDQYTPERLAALRRMEEIRAHLDETRFAWIGATDGKSAFYYRIHSPVVLIEYDQQTPTNLRHLSPTPTVPTREHVHSVIRTPNGNDYGKALLALHRAERPGGPGD